MPNLVTVVVETLHKPKPVFGIEPHKLYTVTTPQGDLPERAFDEIREILPLSGYRLLDKLLGEDPATWTKWMVGSGPLTGTWPKRFAKAYYQANINRGWKLDPKYLSQAGEILGKACKGATYYFEFTDEISWNGGFHDDGSCWWREYKDARDALVRRGGFGVLFYRNEEQFKNTQGTYGIGRCWAWPQQGVIYVFNAYGIELPTIAKLISLKFGLSYRRVCTYTDDAWINNQDHNYAIAPTESLPEYKSSHHLTFSSNL